MKCLIIAAGKGSRLKQQGDSKPLIPILGLPLIERVIRTAMEAGADDFLVVTGYREELVRSFLLSLSDRLECSTFGRFRDCTRTMRKFLINPRKQFSLPIPAVTLQNSGRNAPFMMPLKTVKK